MGLAVRRDADTTLVGTDGDYAPLIVDANGYLKVEVFDGGGSHTVDNAGTFAVQSTLQAGTAAIGKLSANSGVDIGDVDVLSSALPTGAATAANQLADGHNVTVDNASLTVDLAGNNDVTIDGSSVVYTEDAASGAGDPGIMVLARRTASPADTSGLDLDYESLQMDNGRLWTSTTVDAALPAGNNNIGNIDIASSVSLDVSAATVTVDLGANNDVSLNAGTNAIGKLSANSGVDIGDVDVLSSALPTGASTAAKQLADGHNVTVDNSTGASAVNIQDGGNSITVDGSLTVDLGANNDVTLNAGTAAFGKLSANSGVDIGDVDVTSIAAGSTLIGDVGLQPRTSGGIQGSTSGVYRDEDIDETAVALKASSGQIYWIHCVNLDATPVYLHFWNVAQGSVTVGTTTEVMTFAVPSQGNSNGAGFTMNFAHGVEFGTAITVACTTTISGTAGPAANEVILNVGYE